MDVRIACARGDHLPTLKCCNVMSQFIKKAAGDYMGNSGNQAASGEGGGDWSALANLGSQMASHDEQTGGNTNFSQFTNMYGLRSTLCRSSRVVLMLVPQWQKAGLALILLQFRIYNFKLQLTPFGNIQADRRRFRGPQGQKCRP